MAFAAPPDSAEAQRLISDAVHAFMPSYVDSVAGAANAFIPLDQGLAAISSHAKNLGKGRQSIDPAWCPENVAGLVPLLDRARQHRPDRAADERPWPRARASREHRHHTGGAVRWRRDDGAPNADEVVAGGARVLLPVGRAIFAATEEFRYGPKAHGYHSGATLAEAAIPLIVLLPPGVLMPKGWSEHTMGAPSWWDGAAVVGPPSDGRPRHHHRR
ncbi:MAG: hypothetical protein M3Z25_22480 [Actinomycetota bacterium]|nr:hypothetical protein [Actinomycetota bacterium]